LFSITSNVLCQNVIFSIGLDEILPVELHDPSNIPNIYPPAEKSDIYTHPDQQPVFPGGLDSLNTYFIKHGKLVDQQISSGGIIYIEFIMNENGYAERLKIVKDFNDLQCNLEAIRLIKNMPKWIPAEDNGQKVKVRMIIPIKVRIEK